MEHNRKHKLIMILALVFSIASLSIGFAAFSVTLNISSQASVSPSSDTFSVKFSAVDNSLLERPIVPYDVYGATNVTNGIINNNGNPTITNISATFTAPEQYVSYVFWVRNVGEYTAYLNSVNFLSEKICTPEDDATPELVEKACDSIIMEFDVDGVSYYETENVTNKPLEPNTGRTVAITLSYLPEGDMSDGPFTITFPDIALVYSTIDDPSMEPAINKVVKLESGTLNDVGSVVSIGNEKFYVIGKDEENNNVKLLSMYNLHVGNTVDETGNLIPLSNPTGIQDEDSIGYIEGEFSFIGTTAYSYTSSSSYSGSIVEEYVNDYASYLVNLGVDIKEARLITYSELEMLGCVWDSWTCSGAPEFVYQTSYWTSSVMASSVAWIVRSNSKFGNVHHNEDAELGVRPVIEISLSEF